MLIQKITKLNSQYLAAARVKQGAAFSELKPPGRTLFLSNLPTWSTRAALKRLFQCNGPVEEVYLQRAPSAGDPPRQGRASLLLKLH